MTVVSADAPMIKVGDVNVYGSVEEVTVPIILSNNPGMVSMTLTVEYDDSVLELCAVNDKDVFPGAMHSDKMATPYVLTWANDTAGANIYENGVIAELVFKVISEEEIDSTEVRIGYSKENEDILDYDLQVVDINVASGVIIFNNVLLGDVNMDGKVTNTDRAILSRTLANWSGYDMSALNTVAADVNLDGKVTNTDRAHLSRHLANWKGYETLPIQ